MLLFDTHTHLYDSAFDLDRAEVIRNAREAGVRLFMLPNEDTSTLDALWAMQRAYPDCMLCAVGMHPTSVKEDWQTQLQDIERVLRAERSRIAAIGEVGLDFYWDDSYRKEQIAVLTRQVELSIELGLPLILHVRKAFEEIFALLEQSPNESVRGVFHCFDGSADDLARILAYPHIMIGLNGIITFKRNDSLRALVGSMPLDRIVLETDSPYLAPEPMRGRRNESAFIVHTLRTAAQCLRMPEEELSAICYKNALKLFNASKCGETKQVNAE